MNFELTQSQVILLQEILADRKRGLAASSAPVGKIDEIAEIEKVLETPILSEEEKAALVNPGPTAIDPNSAV